MTFVLGIDQGGTKTVSALATLKGEILGVGYAQGSTHISHGIEHAMAQVELSLSSAWKDAGLEPSALLSVGAGMSGADFDEEYLLLRHSLQSLLGTQKVRVENDVMIGMRAGTKAQWGAALSVGTGVNVAVRSPDQREFIFGYYIEDHWQGAIAIGRHAIRRVFDAYAGLGGSTLLTEALTERYGVKDAHELLKTYVTQPERFRDIKELAPLVDELGLQGDDVCIDIINRFAAQYGHYICAGLRRLDMLNLPVEIVLSGSVMKSKAPWFRETMIHRIHQDAPRAYLVDARYEPVVGGLLSALELMQVPLDPDAPATHLIEHTAAGKGLLRLSDVACAPHAP